MYPDPLRPAPRRSAAPEPYFPPPTRHLLIASHPYGHFRRSSSSRQHVTTEDGKQPLRKSLSGGSPETPFVLVRLAEELAHLGDAQNARACYLLKSKVLK